MRVITTGSGGGSVSQAYGRSSVSNASDLSTTSGSPGELSSSLRVTVTVPASGTVLVRQAISVHVSTFPQDAILYVQVDGAGAWTMTGGTTFVQNHNALPLLGEVALTGLTPGPHTFSMGWSTSGGNTLQCLANSFVGAQASTWMSVLTLP